MELSKISGSRARGRGLDVAVDMHVMVVVAFLNALMPVLAEEKINVSIPTVAVVSMAGFYPLPTALISYIR